MISSAGMFEVVSIRRVGSLSSTFTARMRKPAAEEKFRILIADCSRGPARITASSVSLKGNTALMAGSWLFLEIMGPLVGTLQKIVQ